LSENTTMVRVDKKLLDEAQLKFPEAKGLTWTGLVDFLIRYALKQKSKERKTE